MYADLGLQRDLLRAGRTPVVVHALRVFGIPNQALALALAFNVILFADDRENWDVLTSPFVRFKQLFAGNDVASPSAALLREFSGIACLSQLVASQSLVLLALLQTDG